MVLEPIICCSIPGSVLTVTVAPLVLQFPMTQVVLAAPATRKTRGGPCSQVYLGSHTVLHAGALSTVDFTACILPHDANLGPMVYNYCVFMEGTRV